MFRKIGGTVLAATAIILGASGVASAEYIGPFDTWEQCEASRAVAATQINGIVTDCLGGAAFGLDGSKFYFNKLYH
ncbi:hypothetical protein [Nocardia rhizosphaerae]|uniref:Uncharacterized protein n=1 Tax=Nocardia rhizosphaerae TaxID=1691571 RepID=A0ABV8L5B9_9NOCA